MRLLARTVFLPAPGGLILYLFMLVSIPAIPLVEGIGKGGTGIGLAAAVALIVPVLLLVGIVLISILFFILSMVKIHQGWQELGPEHHRNFSHAIVFFALAIVATALGWTFDDMVPGTVGGASIYTLINESSNIARTALLCLFFLYLVKSFAGPERLRLRTGLAVLLTGSIVGMAIAVLPGPVAWATAAGQALDVTYHAINIFISMAGCLILWDCFRRLQRRMESGEIHPVYPGAPGAAPVVPNPTPFP